MRTKDLVPGEIYADRYGNRVRLVMTGTLWTRAHRGPGWVVSDEPQGRHGHDWNRRTVGHLCLTGSDVEAVKIPDITGTNEEKEAAVAVFKAGLPEDVSLTLCTARQLQSVDDYEWKRAARRAAEDAAEQERLAWVARYRREVEPLLKRFTPDGLTVPNFYFPTDSVTVPIETLRAIAAHLAKEEQNDA